MNIALIIAGGKGTRTNQDIPKQFLNINDKPIIIYTLQAFQNHSEIDSIIVVCIDGWQDMLWAYSKQFGISKLKWIVSGGHTGQESIHNGIAKLAEACSDDDIVLIHDAIRPNVSQEIISDSITQCKISGSAVTVIPCVEAILIRETDGNTSSEVYPREQLARTQTPQTFTLGKLKWAHQEAEKRGITNSVATCTLMVELGEHVSFCPGSEKNIKITTSEDLEIFKALLNSRKSDWIK